MLNLKRSLILEIVMIWSNSSLKPWYLINQNQNNWGLIFTYKKLKILVNPQNLNLSNLCLLLKFVSALSLILEYPCSWKRNSKRQLFQFLGQTAKVCCLIFRKPKLFTQVFQKNRIISQGIPSKYKIAFKCGRLILPGILKYTKILWGNYFLLIFTTFFAFNGIFC